MNEFMFLRDVQSGETEFLSVDSDESPRWFWGRDAATAQRWPQGANGMMRIFSHPWRFDCFDIGKRYDDVGLLIGSDGRWEDGSRVIELVSDGRVYAGTIKGFGLSPCRTTGQVLLPFLAGEEIAQTVEGIPCHREMELMSSDSFEVRVERVV